MLSNESFRKPSSIHPLLFIFQLHKTIILPIFNGHRINRFITFALTQFNNGHYLFLKIQLYL